MPETNLDQILSRLAETIGGATGSSPTSPATPTPSPPSSTSATALDDLRKWLAVELYYMQMIPPLTPRILQRLDQYFEQFLDQLKSVKNRPILLAIMKEAMAKASNPTSAERSDVANANTIRKAALALGATVEGSTERSEVVAAGDPELVALTERMARDIAGVPEDRALPVVALVVAGAIAAGVGGTTVGRAIYDAFN